MSDRLSLYRLRELSAQLLWRVRSVACRLRPLILPLGLTIAYSGCGRDATAPSLSAFYVLSSPVVLDASTAGKIVLVYSAMKFSPDNTWTGRDTVTNTEGGSGAPTEESGSGTYSLTDSRLVLRSARGTVTKF